MKKILFFVAVFLCFMINSEGSAALYGKSGFVPVQAPNYIRFYDIDTTEITAKYNPISLEKEKTLSGAVKDTYKKIKKTENYLSQKNYEKAIKENPDFLPTHIKYFNYSLGKNDYHTAMNEIITIKRLNAIDRVLDDNIISYKLGMLYYINKNYSAALTYLSNFTEAHNPSEENLWYALADIYYNLKNYELSIEFSTKITPKSINYFPAQEILYNNYIAQNNIQKARECAKILLQYAPTATNYVRLGNTIQNSDTEKLNLYNRARELALEENDIKTLALADTGIAILEQNKIDNAVKTLTGFVEKPSWQKILEEIGAITEPIELSTRQANFFKSTNYCIKNFNNQDLIKCFEYVNREEAKISNEKLSEYQKEYEAQQQEYELMRRQQEFLERTYYNRMYMDEFLYMRDPYHYYW